MRKPKNYIHTRWEKVNGLKYKQPIEYCNDVKLTSDKIEHFKSFFGVGYTDVARESYLYSRTCLDINHKSEKWKNNEVMEKCFDKVHDFNINEKQMIGGSTTPLFPFEIYLMNDGFEMVYFSELNAYSPSGRSYKKGNVTINVSFGFIFEGKQTNFYFTISDNCNYFQIDNDIENYDKAISGNLKPINTNNKYLAI